MIQLRISMQTARLRETHAITGCVVSVPFNSIINNIDTNCVQAYASTDSAVRLVRGGTDSASSEGGTVRLISEVVLTVPVLRVVL
jgi:hypothetical protein